MVYICDLALHPNFSDYEDTVVAIAWLSPDHDFATGQVSDEVISRLQAFCEAPALVTFGFHSCEFCDSASSSEEIIVKGKDKMYIAPAMIVHYVQKHQYCPPEEFIEAVLNAEFIDGEPVAVFPKEKSSIDPWASSGEMTAREFVHLYKNSDIFQDTRWCNDLADEIIFDIYDKGNFGDERCLLMTQLLRDEKYNKA